MCEFMGVVLCLSCVCVCVYEPATCSGQDSAFLLDNVLGGPDRKSKETTLTGVTVEVRGHRDILHDWRGRRGH